MTGTEAAVQGSSGSFCPHNILQQFQQFRAIWYLHFPNSRQMYPIMLFMLFTPMESRQLDSLKFFSYKSALSFPNQKWFPCYEEKSFV